MQRLFDFLEPIGRSFLHSSSVIAMSDSKSFSSILVAVTALIGAVFAFAGMSKLLDPFLWERLMLDALFATSLAIDVSVGCFLIALPRSKFARLAGLIVSISYLLFLVRGLLIGVWTCNCFGSETPVYFSIGFDLIAIVALSFVSFHQKSFCEANSNDSIFCLLLFALVIGMGIGVNQLWNNRDLSFDIGDSTAASISDGKWQGSLVLRNNTEHACALVGLRETCQFHCFSKLPVKLPPGESASLEVAVSVPTSVDRSKFTSGNTKIFFELGSPSGTHFTEMTVPWGVFNN